MVYGFRRANGVRPLWLARAAFVAAAFQLFLRCSSAMSLMSRSYESPLPKGALFLGDPAQIVEPQNEFVIRKDAGADRCLAEFGGCKRDKSLYFLRLAIMKLTKKKTDVVTIKNNRKAVLEQLEKLETNGAHHFKKKVQSMRESQERLKLLIEWYDDEIEECRAEINSRIEDNYRDYRRQFS